MPTPAAKLLAHFKKAAGRRGHVGRACAEACPRKPTIAFQQNNIIGGLRGHGTRQHIGHVFILPPP
jgi:hypothetical protein